MTTAYTSLLGLALPVTGELSGTWGDTVNNSITSLLDSAIAGTQTLTADTTLTTTTGAANQSRQAILLCSPASANITITAPAQSKIYTVINTSATYTVKIRGVGPTTGVTLAASESAVVAWNGSDFIRISSSNSTTGNFTVNGNLSVTGNTTLGDASADTVTVNGTVTSNLIFTDNTYDIGASGATRPRTGYFGTSVITPFVSSAAATNLLLKSAGTTAVTIDTSQNVGVGVTPSAWGQGRAIEVLEKGYGFWNGTSSAYVVANAYFNSGFKYGGTGQASHYYQYQGAHVWSIAPSGTAGNAISFTQAMTLDASGNVGIGTASLSNGVKTVIQGTQTGGAPQTSGTTQTYGLLRLQGTTFTSVLDFGTNGGNYNWIQATDSANLATNYSLALNPNGGNVGIGTASPRSVAGYTTLALNNTNGGLFDISAAGTRIATIGADTGNLTINAVANMPMTFFTNNAEKMRIDSSGNLLVGTTSAPVGGANSAWANPGSTVFSMGPNGGNAFVLYNPSNVGCYVVGGQTGWTGTSDGTLKNVIAKIDNGLSSINGLNPIIYSWKSDEANTPYAGLIAQEVKSVLPDLVNDNNGTLGVNYTGVIPYLISAIQEQQALIQSLTDRLTALETK